MQPEVYAWEFDIPVARPSLWAFVSDTERLNRLAGVFPVHYQYKPLDTGGSEVVAEARAAGMLLRWVERPCEWVEPEYFRFTRDYSKGPFVRLVSEVRLRDGDRPGTTKLTHTITVTPRHFMGRVLARVAIGVQTRAGFARAYALAPQWAAGQELPAIGSERLPPRGFASRELRRVLVPLAHRLGSPALAEHLSHHLLAKPDSELDSLAPYVLAGEWQVDRRPLLRLFLHATKAGLFDLQYHLICPSCRRSKASVASLTDLREHGHCPSCNIRFGVDFDRAVEVRFSPPARRRRRGRRILPRRPAQHPAPRRRLELRARYFETGRDPARRRPPSIHLTAGRLGLLRRRRRARRPARGRPHPRHRRPVGRARAGARRGRTIRGRQPLQRACRSDGRPRPLGRRRGHGCRADRPAGVPRAVRQRAAGPGAEFSIQNMVFLFTDLVGSTAMYERLGDAAAFGLVRRHFDLLADIYSEHGGALVKTIGDAIMAVFRRGDDAFRAALAMHAKIPGLREAEGGAGLALRIGLHRGPCIAMTANDRIDYFGTTVNTAARVQGVAGGHEVALSPAMLELPEVRAALAETKLPARTEGLKLKGLAGRHAISIVQVPPSA
ncbi:adenylate/guanylate cyclase domain-containing protein [Nannocystis pusilla]|uniref:adenylate/guanylate cyclase domain-containing protein n=1 Tax=Nannocystis pusilla TaxID=889268 RepID=UPI003B7CA675